MNTLLNVRSIILGAFMLLTVALIGNAQTTPSTTDVPRTISYQGLLSSSDGKAFTDGKYQVTVSLYSDQQGTQPIWQDSYTTNVIGGLFNLFLGDSKPLPDLTSMNMPLWIGTSVDGAQEMRPLTPLTASPYALNVADKAITTAKVADGAITAEKVDLDYISEVQIDGEKISAKGTVLNLVSTPGVPLSYDETTQSVTVGRLPAQTGDKEKGASTLANQDQVWSANGDGWDIAANAIYFPVAGDWIGTSGTVDFIVKTGGTQVTNFQTGTPGVPNIIGGDISNTITAASVQGSIIAEGMTNSITDGRFHAISGGQMNTITGPNAEFHVIGGGDMNRIGNSSIGFHHSGIGSGWDNEVYESEAVIAGGHNNQVESYASGILGGHDNIIQQNSPFSDVAGGNSNIIGTGSSNASIAGGQGNNVSSSPISSIGGGGGNNINTSSSSVIGGGQGNNINNTSEATIGGGSGNAVSAQYGTVSGGLSNAVTGQNASVGGGEGNAASADYSTIPGGDMLSTTSSYAHTAVGFYNAPRGAIGVRPTVTQTATYDEPLFMVGNGDVNAGNQSNAFEVSYNGHSVVYDENGPNAGGRVPIYGATYTDNIIYAWGEIAANAAINADFGVASVTPVAVGVYDVTINANDPFGNAITIGRASITVTIVDDTGQFRCAVATSSRMGVPGANTFRVRTYIGGCQPFNLPFMFKVTGRQ